MIPLTPSVAAENSRAVSIPAEREKFRTFLTKKGLRATNQRLAIFDAAFAQREHFTAEQLLDYARAIDDSVSRATVYRTLPIMTDSALLREVEGRVAPLERRRAPDLVANSRRLQVVLVPLLEEPEDAGAKDRGGASADEHAEPQRRISLEAIGGPAREEKNVAQEAQGAAGEEQDSRLVGLLIDAIDQAAHEDGEREHKKDEIALHAFIRAPW